MLFDHLFSPVKEMSPEEIRQYISGHGADGYTLLDVRTPEEYEQKHLPGAKLIPISELADRLEELDPDKPVFAY